MLLALTALFLLLTLVGTLWLLWRLHRSFDAEDAALRDTQPNPAERLERAQEALTEATHGVQRELDLLRTNRQGR